MSLSINVCNKLIVNSNFAKNEIVSLLNLRKEKVHVVYLGTETIIEKIPKLESKENINLTYLTDNNEYILCVSSCVRYHEFLNILKSYKKILKTTKKNIKFIFVMQILDKKYYDEIQKFVFLNFKNKEVIFLKNLNKENLDRLYRHALFYIFSSYTEVFGLTTLEAMRNNCPVMVSNTSALPEINSNSAIFFNPDNIDDIENKMFNLIKNRELRESLIVKGKINIKKFDWTKTFNNTISIILN